MEDKLILTIGYNAEKVDSKKNLHDTFIVSESSSVCMAKVIDKLKIPQIVKNKWSISPEISIEQYIEGWKKQKERAASIHTELIFNDFKAWSRDGKRSDLNYLSRQKPFAKGFSREGYKKVTYFHILKRGSVRSRVNENNTIISLVFHMHNNKIDREIMKRAEKRNDILEEQFGSRKHRCLVWPILNKVLMIDISR